MHVLHHQLSATFGNNYSNRCVQSSVMCKELLALTGIGCQLVQGSVVFLQTFPNGPQQWAWGSFEDHCWVYTEFGELVDFTVRQQHIAQGIVAGGHAMPAIWWDDMALGLKLWRHLPRLVFDEVSSFDDDPAAAQQLSRATIDARNHYLKLFSGSPPLLSIPVVADEQSLTDLHRRGDPWTVLASDADQQGLVLPHWVSDREAELANEVAQRAPEKREAT